MDDKNIVDIKFDFKTLEFKLAEALQKVLDAEESLNLCKENFNELTIRIKRENNPALKTQFCGMQRAIVPSVEKLIDNLSDAVKTARSIAKLNKSLYDARGQFLAERFNVGSWASRYEIQNELGTLKDKSVEMDSVLSELEDVSNKYKMEDFIPCSPGSEKGE